MFKLEFKNTNCLRYWEANEVPDTENWQLIEHYIRTTFTKKYAENVHEELIPDW